MKNKLAIIIPAYNEATVISSTIKQVRGVTDTLPYTSSLIVIDDGSIDATYDIARKDADVVLHHRRNCGLGASLSTGIEYAKRQGYTSLVTYDADGQHSPSDIKKALTLLSKGYDVVIGSRFLGTHERMPTLRKYILKLSNLFTYLFFGVWTSDSQSGFRALGERAIRSIHLRSNRMEVSSEFFAQIRSLNLRFSEFPIHIRYTPYSLSKGQKNSAGINVLLKLLYLIGR